MKFFGQCEPKIVAGEVKAYDCYKDAREKTITQGSVYIPPSTRINTKKKEFQVKYDLKKLEEQYKKEFKL